MYANNCDGVNLKHNKAFLFFLFFWLAALNCSATWTCFFLFFFLFCIKKRLLPQFLSFRLFCRPKSVSMPRRVENIQSNAELTWGHRQEILPDFNGLGLVHAGWHGFRTFEVRHTRMIDKKEISRTRHTDPRGSPGPQSLQIEEYCSRTVASKTAHLSLLRILPWYSLQVRDIKTITI